MFNELTLNIKELEHSKDLVVIFPLQDLWFYVTVLIVMSLIYQRKRVISSKSSVVKIEHNLLSNVLLQYNCKIFICRRFICLRSALKFI